MVSCRGKHEVAPDDVISFDQAPQAPGVQRWCRCQLCCCGFALENLWVVRELVQLLKLGLNIAFEDGGDQTLAEFWRDEPMRI